MYLAIMLCEQDRVAGLMHLAIMLCGQDTRVFCNNIVLGYCVNRTEY